MRVWLLSTIGCLTAALFIYGCQAPRAEAAHLTPERQQITLRKFPYPYRAMLAIDSDADHVDLRKFNLVHEFINTDAETPMGRGLGLDISDSFFLYNGSNETDVIDANGARVKDEMTLFDGTSFVPSVYAPIILRYIRHGWIDTFHSAGDFSRVDPSTTVFSRSLETFALRWLSAQDAPPIIDFSDHGNQSNVANFGNYSAFGFDSYEQGSNSQSPYYISDLVEREGVKFLWADEFDSQYSYDTMLYPIELRDGSHIWGYHRFTGTRRILVDSRGYRTAVWSNDWTPSLLWQSLAPARLRMLMATGGFCIIATHLEGDASAWPLTSRDIEALTRLAHLQMKGLILVADTPRLLWYNLMREGLTYHLVMGRHHPITYIDVTQIVDPVDGSFVPTWQDLRGMTWTVTDPSHVAIILNGRIVPANEVVCSQHTIGIRWYEASTTDWAVAIGTPTYRRLLIQMLSRERQEEGGAK